MSRIPDEIFWVGIGLGSAWDQALSRFDDIVHQSFELAIVNALKQCILEVHSSMSVAILFRTWSFG